MSHGGGGGGGGSSITTFIIGVLAVIGFVGFLQYASHFATFAKTETIATASSQFDETGTINYTTNSSGDAVSYLVYNVNGVVLTKALVFTNSSTCVTTKGTYPCALIADSLESYVGASTIEVVGTIDAEHVSVSSLKTI